MTKAKLIIIYATTWCSDCHRATKYLDKHNISYQLHNVGKDKHAAQTALKLNGGINKVPTILFPDQTVLVEPTNDQLHQALIQNSLI